MEFKMQLNQEELDILEGKQGETLQKIMKTVVQFGDLYGAKRLVPITGSSHFAISFGQQNLEVMFDILDELIKNGIKVKTPFTVNPKPFDLEHVKIKGGQKGGLKKLYGRQKELEEKLEALGIKDKNAYTCTCYLEEVKNKPELNSVLAWSYGPSVIYANSVLGARTNMNPPLIDLFCSVLGKVPEYGLLTDEGRKATWNVVLNTRHMPNPQILGHAIAMKTQGEVPYIQGIETFTGRRIEEGLQDALKDMGTILSAGGTYLFHVDHITPEAVSLGKKLMTEHPQVYIVDDEELADLELSYPSPWKKKNVKPAACFIGCPHLTMNQIEYWTSTIFRGLKMHGKIKVAIPTYLCAAPDVIARFKTNYTLNSKVEEVGIQFTTMCPTAFMKNAKMLSKPVVTSSNTLRVLANARYYNDTELSSIIATGRCQ